MILGTHASRLPSLERQQAFQRLHTGFWNEAAPALVLSGSGNPWHTKQRAPFRQQTQTRLERSEGGRPRAMKAPLSGLLNSAGSLPEGGLFLSGGVRNSATWSIFQQKEVTGKEVGERTPRGSSAPAERTLPPGARRPGGLGLGPRPHASKPAVQNPSPQGVRVLGRLLMLIPVCC